MKEQAARSERRWALGDLAEGEEWFAVTFADQPIQDVGQDRLEHLLEAGDAAWIEAYERMTLSEAHHWHRHAAAEVGYILDQFPPNRTSLTALDIGCGDGRHVRELLRAGVDAYGVDIAPVLIERARAADTSNAPRYAVSDGRNSIVGHGTYDLVTMLYDVVGSSARRADDVRLLQAARAALAPDGLLVLSVMNRDAIDHQITEGNSALNEAELVAKLEALNPSNAMETTGSVFDATCIVRYGDVYFRKEQFLEAGNSLPTEMIVRDRRFGRAAIADLLSEAGLETISLIAVQAGHWDRVIALASTDPRAKEWLVFARDSSASTSAPPSMLLQ